MTYLSHTPASPMERARDRLEKARERRAQHPGFLIGVQRMIMVLTGLLVTILMTVQIVTRYVFGFSIYGIEELMSFFAVWLYFMGSAHGAWSRGHISASLLDVVLPFGRAQQALRVLACAVTTVLTAWMAVWATEYLFSSIRRNLMSLEVGIPLAWVNVVMPLGLILMTFYFLVECIEEFTVLRSKT